MEYLNPTPDTIREDFPEFADVADPAIQRRIDRTITRIDTGWGADFTYAKSLLTAHYLVEDGFGKGDAEIAGYRAAGVSRLKSGTLDVTFGGETSDAGAGEFGTTSYGRRFYALMSRLFGGPLTTGGGCYGVAGAATDVPWAWATAPGFGL